MFGRPRPVVFDPYRHQRRRRRLPAWLWTLLVGLVAGAAGTIVAQQRWLPERLSAADSARLRISLQQAQADRDRLQGELQAAAGQRDAARTQQQTLQREHDTLAVRAAGWDEDLAFLVDALPPDPREGAVAVRAVRAGVRGGVLHYALALSHDGRPIDGVLTLAAEGRSADGRVLRVDLPALQRRITARHVERGEAVLPPGFVPAQLTVRIAEREGGRRLGMRVVLVRGA
jgi:hypothetical protein